VKSDGQKVFHDEGCITFVTFDKMSKETADTGANVQRESSGVTSKRGVDEATEATKNTVVLNESPPHENGDTTVSSVRVVLLGIFLLIIGTMGFYYLPGMIVTNAKGSKLVNSIYCSVITLTTYVSYPASKRIQFSHTHHHLTIQSNVVLLSHGFCRIGFVCGQL
jgi:hypothetical protein